MIAFDNGPADGDYVRYLEAMADAASRNVAAGAASAAMASRASASTGFDDSMTQARTRQTLAPQTRMGQAATRRSTSPATTAAASRAMVLQKAGHRVAAWPALGRGASLLLAGTLLVIVGFLMTPASFVAIGIGIIVAISGLRAAVGSVAAMRRRSGT